MKIEKIDYRPIEEPPVRIQLELTTRERVVLRMLCGYNIAIPNLFRNNPGVLTEDIYIIEKFLNGLRGVL